jgi:hypothetical protein
MIGILWLHAWNCNTQIWKKWDIAICVLAGQVYITSQNRKILGSAYNEVLVTAPCSNSLKSGAFHAWNTYPTFAFKEASGSVITGTKMEKLVYMRVKMCDEESGM